MRIDPAPATTQRTYYRCTSCRARFGVDMLVGVPIDRYLAQMRSIRCPSCGSKRLTLGEGRTLPEDIETRIEGNVDARIRNWRENGEHGESSKAIAAHMTGTPSDDPAAPADLDDVRRCVLLLGHLPEWRPRMAEMARYPRWKGLAVRWDEIEAAYLHDSPDLDGASPRAGRLLSEVL